jgi:hypothetical protein
VGIIWQHKVLPKFLLTFVNKIHWLGTKFCPFSAKAADFVAKCKGRFGQKWAKFATTSADFIAKCKGQFWQNLMLPNGATLD